MKPTWGSWESLIDTASLLCLVFLLPRQTSGELHRTFNLSSFPTCNEIYKCKGSIKNSSTVASLPLSSCQPIRARHWATNLEANFFFHKCRSMDMLLDVVQYKLSKGTRQWHGLTVNISWAHFISSLHKRAFCSYDYMAGPHPSFS
jgi:hypothetical protein